MSKLEGTEPVLAWLRFCCSCPSFADEIISGRPERDVYSVLDDELSPQ